MLRGCIFLTLFVTATEKLCECEERFLAVTHEVIVRGSGGAVKVLADVIPQVEHHFVDEFVFRDLLLLDKEFTHLFVLAVGRHADFCIDQTQEFRPTILGAVKI